MKWCLSSRQKPEYLLKADEIKVEYRDRNFIYDIPEKYPTAIVILNLLTEKDIDWKELDTFNIITQNKIIFCVSNIEQALECKRHNFQFYFGFPVSTFQELNQVKKLGVCYVRLGGALSFSLDKVSKFAIPVRAVPNIASEWPWPDDDGVCGPWIRPEDLAVYEPYISVMEFEDCNTQKERALFRIYAEGQGWPGEVSQLISNVRTKAINRLIHPDFAKTRVFCGQKCQENGVCHYCYRLLELADEELLRNYKEKLTSSKEEN